MGFKVVLFLVLGVLFILGMVVGFTTDASPVVNNVLAGVGVFGAVLVVVSHFALWRRKRHPR